MHVGGMLSDVGYVGEPLAQSIINFPGKYVLSCVCFDVWRYVFGTGDSVMGNLVLYYVLVTFYLIRLFQCSIFVRVQNFEIFDKGI